jgi:ribonucleoside-diphosphate reductase alpha chain
VPAQKYKNPQLNLPLKIKKRDGRTVPFDSLKIENAIWMSGQDTRLYGRKTARKISQAVLEKIAKKYNQHTTPTVENIQDIVEPTIAEFGFFATAKHYILYRAERQRIRELRATLGLAPDEVKLEANSITVLERRYLVRDNTRHIIEGPEQMFRRVAKYIAAAEKRYNTPQKKVLELEQEFYEMMASLKFLPNSPTLMNAGTKLGQLSACFVLPVEDSIDSIFNAVKWTALVHQTGGGTGFSFSRLRPYNDLVSSTKGKASGPISFMTVFNSATETIKQGGKRRGANMGVLRVDHPDIIEFITCKEREGILNNFNISVALTDRFFDALARGGSYSLVNPRTKKEAGKLKARNVFDLIVTMSWKNGEPGVIFIDKINAKNPVPGAGKIEATNPCGEQPLLPFESCNLGSINLSKFVENKNIDWGGLSKMIRLATRFLDNVIDQNRYPIPQIRKATLRNRKIGLGVMGFADMLIELEIPYNSEEGFKTAEKVMKFITENARDQSRILGHTKGSFPNFGHSIWSKKYRTMRNATVTTIAPTGTIGIIAGASGGIEPLFALYYVRTNVLDADKLVSLNTQFEKIAKREGFYSQKLIHHLSKHASLKGAAGVPDKWQKIFATSHDITPLDHIRMQTAFQKYTDNAVSKTINFPNRADVEHIRNAYLSAYKLGCKGLTVYRDGSRQEQVLNIGTSKSDNGVCPKCNVLLENKEGCIICPKCGYSTKCSLA